MLVFAALVLTSNVSIARAEPSSKALSPASLNRTLSATLPDSQHIFPPGAGADIANSQCMICHSAGMVTRQPPLSISVWKSEINKMRTAYGAPMPEEQVDALAKYLTTINGKP
ncbi:c-type cytochrome [Paraburkholderia fungorum]|uniref:c-type cytochrome n=1 Tax=Paraburkholderia fungorum TaxID=134537 RepID=UPI0038780A3A